MESDETAPGTESIQPITIELEPTAASWGKLHDAQTGNIKADKTFTKKVSTVLYNPIVVNGQATLEDKSEFATLLVFSFNPTSGHDRKRFRSVTLVLEFTEISDSPTANNAPYVVDFAPDSQGLLWDNSMEDWVDKATWELNAKVSAGGGPAGGECGGMSGQETEISKQMSFAASAIGQRNRSKDSKGRVSNKGANVASWTIKENKSQGNGVPGLIRFALLLARPKDEGFTCTVTIDASVDWITDVKNSVVDVVNPKLSVIPYKKTDKATEGRAFDSAKLEIYSDLGKSVELKKLASIKPPQKLEEYPKE